MQVVKVNYDFRVACWVAQTNLGYSYIVKSLEVLNIEPGAYSDKYIEAMDEKVNYNKERKTTKEIKSRHSNLTWQKTTQTLRKEANDGVRYASSVGLNLNTSNNTVLCKSNANDNRRISRISRYIGDI